MKKEASSIRVWTLNMLLGKLVVVFRSLSSDDFVDFCTVSKILICFSLIKRFANNHKKYSSHLQVLILHRVAHIKVYLTIYESLKNSYLKKVFLAKINFLRFWLIHTPEDGKLLVEMGGSQEWGLLS